MQPEQVAVPAKEEFSKTRSEYQPSNQLVSVGDVGDFPRVILMETAAIRTPAEKSGAGSLERMAEAAVERWRA